MITKTVLSIVLLGCAVALPRPEDIQGYGPPQKQHDAYRPAPKVDPYRPPQKHDSYKDESRPYAFDYGVRDDYSGANFGHQENSDGNAIKGSYSVALPDGRIQKVNYVADHYNGFQAEVTYEGTATYPEHNPKTNSYGPTPHQPSYKAPPPHQPAYKAPSKPVYQPPQQTQYSRQDTVAYKAPAQYQDGNALYSSDSGNEYS